MLSFQLTMRGNNSWNGRWSGDEKLYYRFRKVQKEREGKLDGQRFAYSFGDGWVANVVVEKIDAKEKRRRQQKSDGFAGYDWMIDEILEHGRILRVEERKK